MPLVIERTLGGVGNEFGSVGHTGAVSCAVWTKDGRYVMTCGFDKSVRLWNPNRSAPQSSCDRGSGAAGVDAGCLKSITTITTTTTMTNTDADNNYDAEKEGEGDVRRPPMQAMTQRTKTQKTTHVVESALAVKTYAGAHGHEVTGVAIANDNASFASCGGDRTVFLWDVTTGAVSGMVAVGCAGLGWTG
jgi:WD40 repeat protein